MMAYREIAALLATENTLENITKLIYNGYGAICIDQPIAISKMLDKNNPIAEINLSCKFFFCLISFAKVYCSYDD